LQSNAPLEHDMSENTNNVEIKRTINEMNSEQETWQLINEIFVAE
jgi:hypothetical protein